MMQTIIVRGREAEVTDVRDFAAGEHAHSPILNTMAAREFVTRYGSRWTGLRADGHMVCDPTGHPTIPSEDIKL